MSTLEKKHYIGIDLGTTNSAICAFDGKDTVIYKSPEQSDVTPSVIYIDWKGHRFYGRKAYQRAASDEKNAAMLFKRFMGTGKVFTLESSGTKLTPVDCSAELLKVLFGYLPEEIRSDPNTVTVITVPSAFNQMKKDATLEAAKKAGIGRTALMQEPVAAVMSVLKKEAKEMKFIVYDLGGGTFDVSVAQYVGGHVNVLAQGGREMCGGRDMDRWIYRNRVLPYLQEQYHLPADMDENPDYLKMKKTVLFAVEEAKIALSSSENEASIWLDEGALGTADLDGTEMSIDLTLTRDDIDELVRNMAEETAELVRETMARASVRAEDIGQIVFIGGPTMYAPLRERVTELLGIEKGTAVNPMTAVAEGAAIYAESIDWESDRHRPKESMEELPKEEEDFATVRYETRTTADRAKIAVIFKDEKTRTVRLMRENGFDSGRQTIPGKGIIEVPLPEPGEYRFSIEIRNIGEEEPVLVNTIRITRTLASVQSIPASHSIAVKALDRVGGTPVPVYLVHANDPLPKDGTVVFHAAQQLVGGSMGALTFSLWEGEIKDPVDDNRYIGTFRIPAQLIGSGVVPVGAQILCDFEMNEAGNLTLGVSIPCVGLVMDKQNFYSRFEGQLDFSDTSGLVKETRELLSRTAQIKQSVVDAELDELRKKLIEIEHVFSHSTDAESIAAAEGDLRQCYRKTSDLLLRYANVIRSRDLESVIRRFDEYRKQALPDEEAAFDNLAEAARYSIDMGSSDFESQLDGMRGIISSVMWRNDNIVRMSFMNMILFPGNYTDRAAFDRLRAEGLTHIENGDFGALREVINALSAIKIRGAEKGADSLLETVGIYKG